AALTVMSGGRERVSSIDPSDYGLVKKYSYAKIMALPQTYLSLGMLKLARTHPHVMFVHTFPVSFVIPSITTRQYQGRLLNTSVLTSPGN
ncbi:hypothetical protein, partial [Bacillus cereus group sp. Bce013]|uniref:hypothetical protein n=1 Tax=Bacillus cereus group sp. Bce013 TaxID=3445250 RepID=UPI003F257FC8